MMRSESEQNDCNSNSSELSEIAVDLIPQSTPVLFVTSRGLHLRTKKKQSPPTSDSGQGTSSSLENTSNRHIYDFKFCDLEKSWVVNRASAVRLEDLDERIKLSSGTFTIDTTRSNF
ncbi:hypothetical protein ACFFRR_000667 [Megaselia abdita]